MIARKFLAILLNKYAILLVSMVALFYITRNLSDDQYGLFGFAFGYVGMFFFIISMGFDVAHTKKVAEGKDLGKCIGSYALIKLTLVLLMIVVVVASVYIWEYVVGTGMNWAERKELIWIMLLYYVLFSLSQIFTFSFGGMKESVKQHMPETVGTFGRAAMVLLLIFTVGLTPVSLTYSYVLTGVIMLVLALLLFKGYPLKRPEKETIKDYAVYASPLALLTFLSTIYVNVDKVVLGMFWPDEVVGHFFFIQRLITVITLIALSLGPILLPSISSYHASGDKKTLKKVSFRAERYTSLFIFPFIMVLMIFPREIIHIFNDTYLPAADALRYMALYGLMVSLRVPILNVLNGIGKQKQGVVSVAASTIINLVLLFVMVPKQFFNTRMLGLGLEGAALAALISAAVGYAIALYYGHKNIRKTGIKHVAVHAFASMFVIGFMYFTSIVAADLNILTYATMRWYHLLILALVTFGIYFLLLRILGELNDRDIWLIKDTFDPKAMFAYVKTELKPGNK